MLQKQTEKQKHTHDCVTVNDSISVSKMEKYTDYRLTDDWRNQRVFLSAGCESRKATSAALKPDWMVRGPS